MNGSNTSFVDGCINDIVTSVLASQGALFVLAWYFGGHHQARSLAGN